MIEVATIDDVPRLVELGAVMHAESSYRDQPYDPAKVGALLASLINGAGAVFVSRRAGVIVGGMAGGLTVNWFNDEVVAFEYALFLEPSARHGIAALKLITAFTRWSELRGARRLRVGVTTGVNVEGTTRLYEAAGFVPAGNFLMKEFPDVHRT